MIDVKIVLEDGGIMPKKATDGSAAYDVFVPQDHIVRMGRDVISLNIRLQIPKGYQVLIDPRSGFSAKGMVGRKFEMNAGGFTKLDEARFDCDVIEGKGDSDFRGIYGVIVHNHDVPFVVERGTKIAQMTFQKVEDVEFDVCEKLDETNRGEGGFGHTGTK